jgi:hypothetical protein
MRFVYAISVLLGDPTDTKKLRRAGKLSASSFEVSRFYFVNWKFKAWIAPSPIFAWKVMHFPAKVDDVFQL